MKTFQHDRAVLSVSFSPNGEQILTGSRDGKVILRDNRTIYELVDNACDWLDDYLHHGPETEVSDDDRAICDIPPRSQSR